MASEDHEDGVSFALPADVGGWIDAEADRRDETRETICRRLLTATHVAAQTDDVEPHDVVGSDELRAVVDAQREEFVDLLEDVRTRVIQVKREADEKAPANHTHPSYAAGDDLDELRDRLDEIESSLETLETTTENGFDNFEGILTHLIDDLEELADRSTVLGKAVLDRRAHRTSLDERDVQRVRVERLQLGANRLGIRHASCEACSSNVDVGLLTVPECPHCASQFSDVTKKTSLFGSHTLETGDPPALDGTVSSGEGDEPRDAFDAVELDTTTEPTASTGDGSSDERGDR